MSNDAKWFAACMVMLTMGFVWGLVEGFSAGVLSVENTALEAGVGEMYYKDGKRLFRFKSKIREAGGR